MISPEILCLMKQLKQKLDKERIEQLIEKLEKEKSSNIKNPIQKVEKIPPKIERKPPKLFRLPEGTKFEIKYNNGLWCGFLEVPGEEPITGSEKSGEWLLRNLGKQWFKNQQDKEMKNV